MSEITWIVICKECGEVDKMLNGAMCEAVARRHKKDNPTHTVYIGSEISLSEEWAR